MKRAISAKELLNMKFDTFDFEGRWKDAFGNPERRGVWFIWGPSGSGKSTFVMALCKELARFGRVIYDSLEDGASAAVQKAAVVSGISKAKGNFQLLDCENMEDLDKRLLRRKSPDFVVIDSFQYAQLSYSAYTAFKERHKKKLLVFISHADGTQPSGRPARSVMYDATLKIWVEGYRAFSRGRFIGPVGYYDIWEERAKVYHGNS